MDEATGTIRKRRPDLIVRTGSIYLHGSLAMEDNMMETAGGGDLNGTMSRVDAAVESIEGLRVALERSLAGLNAMDEAQLKASNLTGLQKDLARAVMLALGEEGKVKDAVRQQRGGDGIDFDAARAAIRSRLDSIRASSTTGGLS